MDRPQTSREWSRERFQEEVARELGIDLSMSDETARRIREREARLHDRRRGRND